MICFKVSCRFVLIVDLGIRDVMVSANGCYFLRCCLIIDVLQQGYSQLYSLLSYSQRYLGACIVIWVFWVCVWVCLCV